MPKPKRRVASNPGSVTAASRGPARASTNNEHPLLCLQYLQPGYRISDCDTAEQARVALRFQQWASLTWHDLRSAPRQGLGSETIRRESLSESVPAHVTPDVEMLAFRTGGSGSGRLLGYRVDRVLHILWIDPHHRLYRG